MSTLKNTEHSPLKWRMVDIVTCAVLAVAFGVVFWAWGLVWNAAEPIFAGYPPAQALLYGMWLVPAVLAPLIVRKVGASLYTEIVAGTISALLGSTWGLLVIGQSAVQGAGAELVFASGRYRRYNLTTAILAGATSTLFATLWDLKAYYYDTSFLGFQLPYVIFGTISGALIAGWGSWALYRSLHPTGVLDAFPSMETTPLPKKKATVTKDNDIY